MLCIGSSLLLVRQSLILADLWSFLQIHFISAVCENMIDGKGMRPGDILTASNGKTVEVRRVLYFRLHVEPLGESI